MTPPSDAPPPAFWLAAGSAVCAVLGLLGGAAALLGIGFGGLAALAGPLGMLGLPVASVGFGAWALAEARGEPAAR